MNRSEQSKLFRQRHKGDYMYWTEHQYSRIKRDQKNKFNSEMNFTLQEFRKWLDTNYKDKLELLLKNYKESNFDRYLSPSIDRIDDYKDYSFNNMQLLTWRENDLKGREGKKNKEQCGNMAKKVLSKPVYQYDLNMNLLKSYPSTHEVERQTGFDSSLIARACRLHKVSKNYRWEYELI